MKYSITRIENEGYIVITYRPRKLAMNVKTFQALPTELKETDYMLYASTTGCHFALVFLN